MTYLVNSLKSLFLNGPKCIKYFCIKYFLKLNKNGFRIISLHEYGTKEDKESYIFFPFLFWSNPCTRSMCSPWAHQFSVYSHFNSLPFVLFSLIVAKLLCRSYLRDQVQGLYSASFLLDPFASSTTADPFFFWKLTPLTGGRAPS